MRRVVASLVTLAALAVTAAPAAADPPALARVVGPDGETIATSAAAAGWAYPRDGSVVQVGNAAVEGDSLRLSGISALGGRLRIARALIGPVPRMDGVLLDGRPVAVGVNRVLVLPGIGWALALQQSVVQLKSGATRTALVALRLHLTSSYGGLPAGSDVLVGYVAGDGPPDGAAAPAADDIPAELLPVYQQAGERYGVPWSILAAIGKVESDHGRSTLPGVHEGVNRHGCCAGPMQFSIPPHFDTWGSYGVDGDGDGVRDVYDPADAIPGAANLLAANGAAADLPTAIWHYNHSQSYVRAVLDLAASYAEGGEGDERTLATATAEARSSDDETDGFSPVVLW